MGWGFDSLRGHMNEQERIKAINTLSDWRRDDETVKFMVAAVLKNYEQPSIGHLARFAPDAFDELYEEAESIIENED